MSQDGQVQLPDEYCAADDIDPAAAVIVVTFPMPRGLVFDWHTHADHQLAWAASGVLTVRTAGVGLGAAAVTCAVDTGKRAARDAVRWCRDDAVGLCAAGPVPGQLGRADAGIGWTAAV